MQMIVELFATGDPAAIGRPRRRFHIPGTVVQIPINTNRRFLVEIDVPEVQRLSEDTIFLLSGDHTGE
jgi:hypothetical protein